MNALLVKLNLQGINSGLEAGVYHFDTQQSVQSGDAVGTPSVC